MEYNDIDSVEEYVKYLFVDVLYVCGVELCHHFPEREVFSLL